MEKTLYKLSKRDQILVFELKSVEVGSGYVVISRKGYLNGAFQEDILPIEPKNVGRANETTPKQQAEMELISKANKLKDKGYKEINLDNEDNPVKVLRNLKGTDGNGRRLPMLAQKNTERITYPGFLQRKYDGMRGIAFKEKGELMIRSRNGKILENLGHILDELVDLPDDWQLDGELYIHGRPLQDIVSLTKRAQPDNQLIKYRVYDILTPVEEEYELRRQRLWGYLDGCYGEFTKYVPTYRVENEDELMYFFHKWRKDGYEGAMWRDPKGVYEAGQRSWGLIKVKDFDEGEYEIIDIEEATGRDEGTAIFVCQTESGVEFNVRPMGTREQRREYFDNFNEYLGEMLTVRHQGWTKDGKPFHARGVAIRNYE